MINFTLPGLLGPGPSSSDLPFASLYHVDLRALEATVGQWARVRDDMRELNETATRDLAGGAARSDWTGENADVTRAHVHDTSSRFAAAYEQAHAVHTILRSLHESLVAGQKALLLLESTAAARQVAISPEGIVHPADDPPGSSFFSRSLDALASGSPEMEQAVQEVQSEIRRILEAASEADRLTARALDDMANSENGERFAASPYHHWEHARASLVRDDAEALIALAGDEDLSADDLHRLGRLLDDHADDPAFATHVIDAIGMEEYLRFAERVDHSAMSINSGGGLAADLRQGLGTALTTSLSPAGDMATAPPGSAAFQQWLTTGEGRDYQQRYEAFQEAGRRPLLDPTASSYSSDHRLGFDVALDLLEASETPADEQFFAQAMDDFIAMKREDHDIWQQDRYPARPDDPGYPLFDYWNPENDLVDRMLGIGAHSSPEAVTAYFDPGRAQDTSRLDYFIGQGPDSRHAATIHDPLLPGLLTTPPGPGLAAALEAAATGLPPRRTPAHRPAPPAHPGQRGHRRTRLEHLLRRIPGLRRPRPHPPRPRLRRRTLRAPAHRPRPYRGRLHAGRAPRPHGSGHRPKARAASGIRPLSREPDAVRSGQNPDAYAAITAANEAYTHLAIDQAVNAAHETNASRVTAVEHSVTGGGQIAGLMTHAQATAVYERHLAADAAYNGTRDEIAHWTNRILASTVDGALDQADFWGPMGIQVREELTDRFFGLFERDSQATAEMQASREYSESRVYFREEIAAQAVADASEGGIMNLTPTEIAELKNAAKNLAESGFETGIGKEDDHQDR